jgi:hypothetical protein
MDPVGKGKNTLCADIDDTIFWQALIEYTCP